MSTTWTTRRERALMEPFENILVRAPNPVGDAVMATPLLRCLRRGWPRARITVLATPTGAALYEGLDSVDAIEVLRRGGADGGATGMWRVSRGLRKRRFDLAVICPNSASSALMTMLAGVPRRVGWSYGGRGWLLTDRLRPEMRGAGKRVPTAMVGYYLDLARHLDAEVTSTVTELVTTPDGEREAMALLDAGGWDGSAPLAGLGVGASFGPSKMWTPEAFAAVGNGLAERGFGIVLVYGPGEEAVAAAVEARLHVRPVVGANAMARIAGLKSLAKRMSVMVTTDTGPRHIAVAFGVPVVVIMGPTDPAYTDCNLEKTVVLRQEVDCAPYRWPCHEKACPLTGPRHHQCMVQITPEQALKAVESLLRT
jgi:heptosyltransferase-2